MFRKERYNGLPRKIETTQKIYTLDDYGKEAVDAVLRKEFNRAKEQGTLNSSMSISVSVRSKPIAG